MVWRAVVTAVALLLVAVPAQAVVLMTGWWYSPAQGGRGWAISYRDYTKVFIGGFYYADNGAPVWTVSTMTQTAASISVVTTPSGSTTVTSYTLEGDLMSCANGGPLSDPAPRAPTCAPIGRATLQSDSPYRVRLTLDRTGADRVVIDLVPYTDY